VIGALLSAATAMLVSAQTPAPTPAPPPERTAMIVELAAPARVVGLPRCCPGSDCTRPAEDEICFAELYQGWALVVRHLSGPRTERRILLRMTAHARRWNTRQRFMVHGGPFTDQATNGWFASYWILPDSRGRFCHLEDDVIEWADSGMRQVFLNGRRVMTRFEDQRLPSLCISA
jgi:hypothetical protein